MINLQLINDKDRLTDDSLRFEQKPDFFEYIKYVFYVKWMYQC